MKSTYHHLLDSFNRFFLDRFYMKKLSASCVLSYLEESGSYFPF